MMKITTKFGSNFQKKIMDGQLLDQEHLLKWPIWIFGNLLMMEQMLLQPISTFKIYFIDL